MPSTETPTPRIGAADPALPDVPPSDLATFRELLNARRYLRGVSWGTLEGEDRVTVGGNAAAPSLAVGAINAAALRDSTSQWWPAFAAAATLTSGALAASTVHYLYLQVSTSGVPSFAVSTTAPTEDYLASGSQLSRCVAAFCTGLLGFPLPAVVRQRSGRYIASSGRAELVALDNGQSTSWASVSLAALVPPYATTALVMARLYRAAADAGGIELRVRRSSADGGHLVAAVAQAGSAVVSGTPTNLDTYDEKLVRVPLLAAAFEYQLNAAVSGGTSGARFIVVGWES